MMNMYLSGFNRVFNFTAEDRASYPFGFLILAEVRPDSRRTLEDRLDKGSIHCLYDDERTSERALNLEDYGEVESAVRAYAANRGVPVAGIRSETCTIYLTIPAGLGMTFLAETEFESGEKDCNVHCRVKLGADTLFSRSLCIKDYKRLLDWTADFWNDFNYADHLKPHGEA